MKLTPLEGRGEEISYQKLSKILSYGAAATRDRPTKKMLLLVNEDPPYTQREGPVQHNEGTVLQGVQRHSIYLS